jgi:serine/threonine protein kinase
VIPRYQIVREINQGAQGVIYEAIQEATGRKVAVKVLRGGAFIGPKERARFETEVQVLAALSHPNIVQVIDRGTTPDGSYFLVMPYISGRPLDKWLQAYYQKYPDGPPLDDPSELLRLFLKICDAVNVAHLRGVVHRDLKPSNICMDESGEPHILDFGLARTAFTAMTDEQNPQPVTITGQFLGSLPWASPEQAEGAISKIDTRTDVYALGVILYQMLTGKFPYEVVGNMADVLKNIQKAQPPPPSSVLGTKVATKRKRRLWLGKHQRAINSTMDAIILKALAKERGERYQSAGDLARDLASYLSGRPTDAAGEPPRKALLQERPVLVGLAIACVALVLAIVWGMNRSSGPRTSAPAPTLSQAANLTQTKEKPSEAAPLAAPSKAGASQTIAQSGIPTASEPKPAVSQTPQEAKTIDLGGGVKMEFVLIQPGSFIMGADYNVNLGPAHKVNLTKPFYLGKYEVTQEQWEALMGNNPSANKGAKNPVENVSWDDCQVFLAKLMQKVPRVKLALPTAAQWEFACRAGSTNDYCCGVDVATTLDEYAWFSENSGGKTQPVGMKKPNPWGLYDMHGSVREWCNDRVTNYTKSEKTDPVGSVDEHQNEREFRGGAFNDGFIYNTSHFRGGSQPNTTNEYTGFRVRLDAP